MDSRLEKLIQRSQNDKKFAEQIPGQNLSSILGLMLDIPKARNRLPSIIEGLEKNDFTVYQRDEYFATLPEKMPPTIIFQGTLDPKTDYNAATRHIEKLSNVGKVILISVKDAPHFIALFAQNSFAKIASKFVEGKLIKDTLVSDESVVLKNQ